MGTSNISLEITNFRTKYFRDNKMIEINTIKPNEEWSFADVKKAQTMYASHGYHKYPAKFIPQIVQKLLGQYSAPGDTVLDPFGGCGTTLIEAKLNGRHGVSVDVNKVAILITKAKLQGINPEKLKKRNDALFDRIETIDNRRSFYSDAHPRLKYWFKRYQYNRLQAIYSCILEEKNSRVRTFFLCCFSNILKNCSIWFAKSIKPMRDEDKVFREPIEVFKRHLNYMTRMNEQYYQLLKEREILSNDCKVIKGDARNLKLADNSVDLIISSPPYVTSYEYADLHQLSTLWFGYATDLSSIKKSFVGTSTRIRARHNISSDMARLTIGLFLQKRKRLAKSISNYYVDLERSFKQMYKVLKSGKKLCLILGDTEYLDIKVPNTEVSIELLESCGFQIKEVIKRKLSSKIFTPFRDKTGKFTDAAHSSKRHIYQYEFVVVAEKR